MGWGVCPHPTQTKARGLPRISWFGFYSSGRHPEKEEPRLTASQPASQPPGDSSLAPELLRSSLIRWEAFLRNIQLFPGYQQPLSEIS